MLSVTHPNVSGGPIPPVSAFPSPSYNCMTVYSSSNRSTSSHLTATLRLDTSISYPMLNVWRSSCVSELNVAPLVPSPSESEKSERVLVGEEVLSVSSASTKNPVWSGLPLSSKGAVSGTSPPRLSLNSARVDASNRDDRRRLRPCRDRPRQPRRSRSPRRCTAAAPQTHGCQRTPGSRRFFRVL
jgi:hypothetical protein